MEANTLYYGDNLDVLRRHIGTRTADLVYLDPPFNSNQDYNILFQEQDGSKAASQIKAFNDTWRWDMGTAAAFHEVVQSGGPVAEAMVAFERLVGHNDLLAYLSMMAPRLKELYRVLKPDGSIYLHCDSTASHYLRLLLDRIFGPENFRNEIVWKRFNFHADARRFGRVADRILFYSKSNDYKFKRQYAPYKDEYKQAKFTHADKHGRLFQPDNLNPPGGRGPVYEFHGVTRAWRYTREKMLKLESEGRIYTGSKVPRLKRFWDELEARGGAVSEIWDDIPAVNSMARERLGYPTQKPEALLERILAASSLKGDTVLDPFCGCGTTIAVAQNMRDENGDPAPRRWVGIDITYLAIALIKHRLKTVYDNPSYQVIGEPVSLPDAEQLADQDPFQFQWWALGLVDARPVEQKKGSDKGIDGKIYFFPSAEAERAEQIIISVKGGKVEASHVRDLRGVVEREKAAIGVLISLNQPTHAMREEAATAGFYTPTELDKKSYPRIQLVTIEELLAGRRIDYPPFVQKPGETILKPTLRAKPVKTEVGEKQLAPYPSHASLNNRKLATR